MRRVALAATVGAALSTTAFAPKAHGQESCGRGAAAADTRAWSSPLDRRVTVRAGELSLRHALDRLAATARVRFSYAGDLLPLDQRVCLSVEQRALGDVLVAVLRGLPVEPVGIAGADHVVLAPARPAVASTEPVRARQSIGVLDRVVVTGSAIGGAERTLPYALDVVSRQQLGEHDNATMSSALDGAVPGLWLWQQSPVSLLARYGSIRGASSFGLSYPKIYVDGIEVANPLLVTQIDPASVERIEVIRGPQGAALYGADAISGVINIVSRHGGIDGGAPRFELRSAAGTSASDYSQNAVLTQTHGIAARGGSGVRSAGAYLSLGGLGAFIPEAYARQLAVSGDARSVGTRSTISAFVRFYGENAGAPRSPVLATVAPTGPSPDSQPPFHRDAKQSIRQYTIGGTASFQQNEVWTHSVTVGVDGYRLSDASLLGVPFPSAADSALRAARGRADRGTLRASSVARFGTVHGATATITLAAEHSSVREESEGEAYAPRPQAPGPGPDAVTEVVDWRGSSGIVTQVTGGWGDSFFLTAGTRLERSSDGDASEVTMLPMIGAAFLRDGPIARVKLRAAFGRGIRAPQTTSRGTTWFGMRRTASATDLEPEEQSGVEFGADLYFGGRASLSVTRFDQTASGLIQPVAIAPGGAPDDPQPGRRIPYQLQNVGEIGNHGWEMHGSWRPGALALSGTWSLVNSRVDRVARNYRGDLQEGDRMLEVPERTVGFTASWTSRDWFGRVALSRAYDWVNYDRLALAETLAELDAGERGPVGAELRSYWRTYDGATRLEATFSRDLTRGLTLVLNGTNLLGEQRGEPDDVTVVPGRTVTLGVRLRSGR